MKVITLTNLNILVSCIWFFCIIQYSSCNNLKKNSLIKHYVNTMFIDEHFVEDTLNNVDLGNINRHGVDNIAEALADKFIHVHKNFELSTSNNNNNNNGQLNNLRNRKLLSQDKSIPDVALAAINPGAMPDIAAGGSMPSVTVEEHTPDCYRELVIKAMQCEFCTIKCGPLFF